MEIKHKVIFKEPFRDGSIFGTKVFKTDEVAILSDGEFNQAAQSGAVLEVVEQMIPNPKKSTVVADSNNAAS